MTGHRKGRGDAVLSRRARWAVHCVLVATCVIGVPRHALGQSTRLTVEAGASQVQAPAEAGGGTSRFLVGGLRVELPGASRGGWLASVSGGRSAAGGLGGNYVAGNVDGSAWFARGGWGMLGVRARALGFKVTAPVLYSVVGVEGGPSLLLGGRRLTLRLDGVGGLGRSHTRYEAQVESSGGRPGGRDHMGGGVPSPDSMVVTNLNADLWRYGGSAELLVRMGPAVLGGAAGVHESAAGTFRFVGLRAVVSRGRFSVGGRVDRWATPTGSAPAAALWVSADLGGGWSLRGLLGRTEPDPLTLASASRGGGGFLLGREFLPGDPETGRETLYETRAMTAGGGARVQIRVRPPRQADSVQVTGDFTLWEAEPMRRHGEVWLVELEIPGGVHHFGFLVDGEWYVPAEAQDAVPDEWGRRNATLVVEHEGER